MVKLINMKEKVKIEFFAAVELWDIFSTILVLGFTLRHDEGRKIHFS